MDTFLYQKIYEQTPTGTVRLTNPEPALEYCNDIYSSLLDAFQADDHIQERSIKLKLFRDFKAIYEYDCVHDVRPDPFGSFVSREDKDQFIRRGILIEDFNFYLGSTLCSYHEWMAKECKDRIPVLNFQPLVIDYNELYQRAANEYFGTLLGVKYPVNIISTPTKDWDLYTSLHSGEGRTLSEQYHHCPGTTFILPSLIEHTLSFYLSNRVLFIGYDRISEKIESGSAVLTPDEQKLYDMITAMRRNGQALFTIPKDQFFEHIYHMFIRLDVINDHKDSRGHWDIQDVLMEKMPGLGGYLHSDFCKREIRSEYSLILTYLFDKKYLNIRNCIMHGNSVTYDYLAIGIAGVMMQLLWDIGTGDVLKEYHT